MLPSLENTMTNRMKAELGLNLMHLAIKRMPVTESQKKSYRDPSKIEVAIDG